MLESFDQPPFGRLQNCS